MAAVSSRALEPPVAAVAETGFLANAESTACRAADHAIAIDLPINEQPNNRSVNFWRIYEVDFPEGPYVKARRENSESLEPCAFVNPVASYIQ